MYAKAIRYNAMSSGGWGIRRRKGGRLYNMMGDGGHAVEICYRDEAGKAHLVTVGYRKAEQLAADITRAVRQRKAALSPADNRRPALTAAEDGGQG